MADSFIQVPVDSTGKQVDTSQLNVNGQTVERQRIVIGSDTGSATFAAVVSAGPASNLGGLVTRNIPSGTQNVDGVVGLSAGTANIGFINHISATVNVAVVNGLALNASTANIGTINNVSATVVVSGTVSLGASTANIGTINNISANVNVVNLAGANNIGGVSLVAGTANIGFINNISATVVTGMAYVLEKTTNSQVQVGDSLNAAIRVNIVAGAGAGGTSLADGAGFTQGTTALTPAGGVFNETRSTVLEDKVAALRITDQAGLHVNLRTDGGAKMEDSANTALRVNIVAGGGTGGTAISDRAAFVEAVTLLNPSGGVFNDTRVAIAEDTVAALRLNAQGGLHVNLRDAGGTEITASNPLSVKVERQSATVNTVIGAGTALMGAISLAAGTANIGFINGISATIAATLATGGNNIGGVSLVAGTANIGFINGISATIAAILAAGTANIGSINNISATVNTVVTAFIEKTTNSQVQVADSLNAALRVNIVADVFATAVTAIISTSHGPKMVVCSVSANTTLIPSPGAGVSIYVTQLMVSNAHPTAAVLARIGTSAQASTSSTFIMNMAANGGGFVLNLDPPWKLSASEAAICSVKPGGANGYFNINYYVAA